MLTRVSALLIVGQKAPSAKRCIKTRSPYRQKPAWFVRKHRAPKVALRPPSRRAFTPPIMPGQKAPSAKRCIKTAKSCSYVKNVFSSVRKHRAPKGALRQHVHHQWNPLGEVGQKAPSAKRCIKTRTLYPPVRQRRVRQKAPSAKRCIKTQHLRLSR